MKGAQQVIKVPDMPECFVHINTDHVVSQTHMIRWRVHYPYDHFSSLNPHYIVHKDSQEHDGRI